LACELVPPREEAEHMLHKESYQVATQGKKPLDGLMHSESSAFCRWGVLLSHQGTTPT